MVEFSKEIFMYRDYRVNLFAYVHRLFNEDFSSLVGTIETSEEKGS